MDKGVYVILQLISIFLHFLSTLLNLNKDQQCPAPASEPLLLTPYILSNQTRQAINLSKVKTSCLEDFVPPSHSGFITVDQQLRNHMFFWYFPSPTNASAPLLVWLNGGPGVSSIQGLLYQSGPLKIEGRNSQYTQRKDTFVGPFSVVYIDNPTGIGYSYSESGTRGYRFSQDEYGRDLLEFMNQFLELFPQYKTDNEVYIGGQSYAGKYIPVLGSYIHEAIRNGTSTINLKGIYLGGPLFDPETNFEVIHDFYFCLGIIGHKTLLESKRIIREDFRLFKSEALENDSLNRISMTVFPNTLPRANSHENYAAGETYDQAALNEFMTSWKIRSALHVGVNTQFTAFNVDYFSNMTNDIRTSSKERLALLMDNYKVMIYNGDFDVITNTLTIEAGLMNMNWTGRKDYEDALRLPWVYGNKVLGYYSSVGQFCRVIVHRAGHHIGMDQPLSNLILMKQFIEHGCVS